MNDPREKTMYRILLVDDEENILRALRRVLAMTPCMYDGKEFRLKVDTASDPHVALQMATHTAYDLVLSDFRMPELDGVQFLKAFRNLQPDSARLIISGYADLNALIGAINEAQIYRFLSKPWNDYELVSAIGQALAYRDLLRENERLADRQRAADGAISEEDLERRILEAEEPGITRVKWGSDGSVLLDEDLLDH
jgi:two-component system, probable response regulator PhcQ